MDKSSLRKEYLDIRRKIPNKLNKSLIIKDKVLSLLDDYQVIGVYSSMDDEVNTDELIKELLKLHKEVVIPKIEEDGINFYQISSIDDLVVTGKYQIREPIDNKGPKCDIEAMIIPGICFDMKKNRLGFGKAYFDRYLKDKKIFKIGICFDECLIDEIPINNWDIKMDIVISDKQIVR